MHYIVGTIRPGKKTLVQLTQVDDEGELTGEVIQEETLPVDGVLEIGENQQLIITQKKNGGSQLAKDGKNTTEDKK